MMNQTEETKLLEQLEQWNDAGRVFSRCIRGHRGYPGAGARLFANRQVESGLQQSGGPGRSWRARNRQ
ncbi:MAG: hypothetical protein ACLT76_06525 [Clostridium fessum]